MNVETEYTTTVPRGGALVDQRAPEDEREERKRRADRHGYLLVRACLRRVVSGGYRT